MSQQIDIKKQQQNESNKSLESGMGGFYNSLTNNLSNSINDVVNDLLENVEQQQKNNFNNQNQVREQQQNTKDQLIQQDRQNLQKIQIIRKKEIQLIQQLQRLKEQEQQLLIKSNIKHKNIEIQYELDYNKLFYQKKQDQQRYLQENKPLQNQQEQQQFNFFYQPLTSKTESLPHVRRKRKKYVRPKIKMPQPVVPQLSRSQFEKRVKQIAGTIRSKVHKQNPLLLNKQKKNLTKSVSREKYRQQKYLIKLPEIQPRKAFNKTDLTVNRIFEQIQQDNSNIQSDKNNSNQMQRAMKSIVDQIVKISLQKIRYKQKYGLKLDPIHYRYPMTSFRKKVIQQKYHKQKQKYVSMTQSLRNSMINQRKLILQKSRKNK